MQHPICRTKCFAYPLQASRSSHESQNQSAQGSRNDAVPPSFNLPFANDLASMFMNIAANTANVYQGQHPQERQEESDTSSTDEPEIRIGGNINLNLDQMPEDMRGAFRSMMEMFSGAVPPGPGQPQNQFNGRTAPN